VEDGVPEARPAGKKVAKTRPKTTRTPTSAPRASPPPARPVDAARRRRNLVRGALLAVVLVGVLFGFVYPTRTFLDQRSATQTAQAHLDLLRAQNAQLADQARKLNDDAEIARIARELYGLVKPGEQPFVILPVSPTTTTTTLAPPTPAASSAPAAGAAKTAP